MIGFINRITTVSGERDKVMSLVLEGSDRMDGCRSYIVAADAGNPDIIWVTEIWDDAEKQQASLENPIVKAAIEQAMPLIAGFENVATTAPQFSNFE
ncbi:MAG: antibiotic biosynthesis monooxygenase [Methyloceanibacter sp.]|nr:MAG: antibiotic biosynthesis monooxygenase [Methyloceanibacter sp.]